MSLNSDIYENNNDFDIATILSKNTGTVKNLTIHDSDDVDYYKISLTNTGMAKNLVKATFTNAKGNLDLRLFDAAGNEIGSSTSTANSEQISLEGLAAGEYYLKVYGVDSAQNTYALNWDQTNYGPKIDAYDAKNPNDSMETATTLTAVKGSAASRTIHSVTDVDYYKISLSNIGMAKNLVKATFTNAKGNLDMKLFDASGNEVASSASTANSEQISLEGLAQGDYYLKVYGVDGAQNTYTLSWDQTNYGPKIDAYDAKSPNDSIDTATTLTAVKGSAASRTIHSVTDVDYYKISLANIGMAKNLVKATFTNANGNLDMKLFDASGTEVGSSTSTANSEQISLEGLAAGEYYLKVDGVDGAQNTYTLSWDQTNYGPKIDAYDAKSPNDSKDTATTLTAVKGSAASRTIHSVTDVDYYKITLANTGREKNLVKATFTNANGNLDMRLFDAAGNEVASSTSTANSEQISLQGLAQGDYYLKVYGVDGAQNTYTLNWDGTNYGPKADSYEGKKGNETIETATNLAAAKSSVKSRTIHSVTDVDYYKITLANVGMAKNFVTATFANADGNLDMKLLDASGNEVSASTATADGRQINLQGLAAGEYYLKVYGVDGAQNTYALSWDKTNYGPKIDSYEGKKGNETIETATNLAAAKSTVQNRSIHSVTDVDYYKITLANVGMAKNFVTATFANADGNLDMKLLDASGNEVSASTATADGRQISLQGLAAGEYYLKVYGVDGAQNTYALSWDKTNYGPKIDSYEGKKGNETIETATNLAAAKSTVQNRSIHSVTDVDYYKIVLPNIGMAKNFVTATFANADGNLDMKLFDASGNEVSASTATADGERISLEGLTAGNYYLKVYGVDGAQNIYALSWDRTDYGPKIDTYDAKKGNETVETATKVAANKSTLKNLSIHTVTDVDYYTISLSNTGTTQNFVQTMFTHADGNLDMKLFDASGNEVGSSTSTADGERISLQGLAAGNYYLKVYGVDGARNTYTLDWDKTNYGEKVDQYEKDCGNNTILTASKLPSTSGSHTGATSIHSSDDVDYFKVVLAGPGIAGDYFKVSSIKANGKLDVTLVDASGTVLRSSTSPTANSEQIDLQGLDSGTYYVRVSGVDGAVGTYNIAWRCRALPDKYEGASGNDTIATAAKLPYAYGGSLKGYTNIQSRNDVDYFKITLNGRGVDKNFFTVNSINANGKLNVTLVDASGRELRSSLSLTENSEHILLQGLQAGTYYVKVSGVDGAIGTYNLSWNPGLYLQSLSSRESVDMWTADRYESNGASSSATTILAHAGKVDNLTIHTGSDEDYYKITLDATGTAANYIQASFNQAWGNLDMKLYNAANVEVGSSTSTTGSERISLQGLAAGTYYVKVYGVDGAQNTYSLAWDRTDQATPPSDASTAETLLSSGNSLKNLSLNERTDAQYYKFDLATAGTASNYLTINSADHLQASLWDADGRMLYTTDSRMKINLSGLDSGTYYLKVEAGDMVSGGSAAQYDIDYNIVSSSATNKVVGTDYSSLFAINDAHTQYAYLMGYGNINIADFTTNNYIYKRLSYSNDLFFDAEKSTKNTRDDNHCWAGTASNMLAWTGWGEKGISSATGNSAEDVIFAEYNKYFPDKAGIIQDGIRWFFESNYKNYSNSLTATKGSGNYLGFSALPGLTVNTVKGVSSLHAMAEALANNAGVGLMVAGPTRHAITVWGYTFDATKSRDDGSYYTGLLITDSDDNKNVPTPDVASDTLNMVSLVWNQKSQKYAAKYWGSTYNLESFITLDHSSNWPTQEASVASAPTDSTLPVGDALDTLLASATQPSADTMRAASALTYKDDRYKEDGMLTA